MNPRRLPFQVTYDGELTRARMICEFGTGVLEKQVTDVWPDVYEAWRDAAPADNPYFTHAVNNNNRGEVALYLGLAWALTEGLDREVLISGDAAQVKRWFDRDDLRPTRWEYLTQADALNWQQREGRFVRVGDVRGAAPSGTFPLDARRELVNVLVASLSDVWATVLVVGMPTTSTTNAADRLSDIRPPTMSSLLSGGGVAVDVTIGVDLGYFDSVDVAMSGDRRTDLERVLDEFRQRIATFETSLPSVSSLPDYQGVLDILIGEAQLD